MLVEDAKFGEKAAAGKAQESPKCWIVVIRQPHRTERYPGSITRDRTKRHFRKLSRDSGLAGKAHAEAERHKMHQSFPANIEPLYPKAATKLRQASDQLVMDCPTQFRLAQDHLLVTKSFPCDLIAMAEHVALGERHKYLLAPKLSDFAIRQARNAQNEGDIQSAFANERNLLARRTFHNVHFHV